MDRYTVTKKTKTKSLIARFSQSPGVYLFKDASGRVIYVGKAKNLQKRLRQYFERGDALGEKTLFLVPQISGIETVKTISELDALLLEARLIHDHNPKYNSIAKDDKSPLYVAITFDEQLPRVLFVRKPDIARAPPKRVFFGPFQSSHTVRMILRQLRSVTPYCSQKKRDGKPCFYTHLGLCNPCASMIAKMQESPKRETLVRSYRKSLYRLRALLSGKSAPIIKELTREMQAYAKQRLFEEAANKRNQISRLRELGTTRYDPYLYMEQATFLEHMIDEEQQKLRDCLRPYYPHITLLSRIECIDVSNISGTHATGSVVVFTGGVADTAQYRKFHIRTKKTPNDVAMIQEIITRRFRHPEWPFPNLLVIDGGKPQTHAAAEALIRLDITMPVIGLAKRYEEIIIPRSKGFAVIVLPLTSPALQLIQRIRDEAHRFALSYHRLLRRKAFV